MSIDFETVGLYHRVKRKLVEHVFNNKTSIIRPLICLIFKTQSMRFEVFVQSLDINSFSVKYDFILSDISISTLFRHEDNSGLPYSKMGNITMQTLF